MAKQQTAPNPPTNSVADAEQTVARLQEQREKLVAERARAENETSKHAYAAHARGDMKAVEELDQIATTIMRLDAHIREVDLALAEAGRFVLDARQAEAAAADRLRAEAASKLAHEFAATFAYADKHFRAAIDALIAIDHEIAKLHELGCAFPSHQQLRLGVVTAITTELQRLPRTWFNELSGGLRYLAPNQKRSFSQYWNAIELSLNNQIGQRGKPES
jgi:hypothetical protein